MGRAKWLFGVSFLLLPLATVIEIGAYSPGVDSYSGNPDDGGLTCNKCHDGGVIPTVVMSGPTVVGPGETNSYSLVIGGGQERAGGLDVSATGGTFGVIDAGTYILEGELTHASPRLVQPGTFEATFFFNWTAPITPGTYTLYGAGNSVNLQSGPNGDRAATDVLEIMVAGSATPGEASGPASNPLLVTDFDPLTGELTLGYDVSCETTDHNLYFGDLSLVSSHAWSGEVCGIGVGGTYAGFDPGFGSYFFVVVGNKDADEGSYGQVDPVAGPNTERPAYGANGCGQVQNLSESCD